MKEKFYRILIELTNGRVTSSCLKTFSRSKLSRRVVSSFCKTYNIDMRESDRPMHEFTSLHDFFTRTLKVGTRPIDEDVNSVVSPVDAVFEDCGIIDENCIFTVKGKSYSVNEMFADRTIASNYINGFYIVLYLSPSHYHRIHSPVTGEVKRKWTLGQKSYPVNKYGLKYGKETLAKNYRVITEIEHPSGKLAVVKVGAMFINSIESTFSGQIVEKGQELAYFTFGSTVILMFEKDSFEPINVANVPFSVQVGQVLGYIKGVKKSPLQ